MPTLSALLLTGLLAQAPPPPPPPGDPLPILAQAGRLELGKDQIARLRTLQEGRRAAGEAKRKLARTAVEALVEALRDPDTADARLRDLHGVAAAARLEAMLEARAGLREALAVLTPDQRKALRTLDEGRPHPGGGPGRRGHGRPDGPDGHGREGGDHRGPGGPGGPPPPPEDEDDLRD